MSCETMMDAAGRENGISSLGFHGNANNDRDRDFLLLDRAEYVKLGDITCIWQCPLLFW